MSTTADLIALEEEDDELIAPLPGDALPSEEPLFVSDEELPTATSFKSAYERFESAHSFAPIELGRCACRSLHGSLGLMRMQHVTPALACPLACPLQRLTT